MRGFPCPKCGSSSSVTETRALRGALRRRRRCENFTCDQRFTTYEVFAANARRRVNDMALVSTHKLEELMQLLKSFSPVPLVAEDDPAVVDYLW